MEANFPTGPSFLFLNRVLALTVATDRMQRQGKKVYECKRIQCLRILSEQTFVKGFPVTSPSLQRPAFSASPGHQSHLRETLLSSSLRSNPPFWGHPGVSSCVFRTKKSNSIVSRIQTRKHIKFTIKLSQLVRRSATPHPCPSSFRESSQRQLHNDFVQGCFLKPEIGGLECIIHRDKAGVARCLRDRFVIFHIGEYSINIHGLPFRLAELVADRAASPVVPSDLRIGYSRQMRLHGRNWRALRRNVFTDSRQELLGDHFASIELRRRSICRQRSAW
jgi:hypothetical protein